MKADMNLQRVSQSGSLRGFSNLVKKDNRAWWGTNRWWINALLWTVLLCGLTAAMLFGPNEELQEASAAEIAQMGGETAYLLSVAFTAFFEFGVPVLAIGAIIQAQDLILGEKQNGLAEWLLAKPVSRRAYILAKLTAILLPALLLLIGLPALLNYGLISYRLGEFFPLQPYLAGIGMLALHTLFYLTLTLMLGTMFNQRGAILGITLGSVLGGGLLGGLVSPLYFITPWLLAKMAALTASGQALPSPYGAAPVLAAGLWSALFILGAFLRFERAEF